MTMYVSIECPTCVVPPLLFVRNVVDGKIALYCNDCGAVYRLPDGLDFAYGGSPDDMSKFRSATLAEIEEVGFRQWARAAQGPVRFP